MNKNIERKNVGWEDVEGCVARNLVIKCPCKDEDDSDFIELIFKISEACAQEKIDQLVRFLYDNYPEIFWEYVEKRKVIFINDRFYDETLAKFLIEIIPDIFPDCRFSIDLTKMPEITRFRLYEEGYESNIDEPIEIEVEVDTNEFIGDMVKIEKIINWLEGKTGFNVAVTNYSIKRDIKVKGIK